jgi:hypothetical protein
LKGADNDLECITSAFIRHRIGSSYGAGGAGGADAGKAAEANMGEGNAGCSGEGWDDHIAKEVRFVVDYLVMKVEAGVKDSLKDEAKKKTDTAKKVRRERERERDGVGGGWGGGRESERERE